MGGFGAGRGWRLFRVAGLAVAGLAVALIVWKKQQDDVEAERLSRVSAQVEPAPAPLPRGLPLLGAEGTDAEGFPLQSVDQAALRSLLFHRRYPELEAAFTHFQEAFEKDPRFERWPVDAAAAFGSAERSLRPRLDRWVEAAPGSFAPWLARGAHLAAVAHGERGAREAKETADADFTQMRATLPLARADLEEALRLRPRLVVALLEELRVALLEGDHNLLRSIAGRGEGLCPSCFELRVKVLQTLRPRWGGSDDAMRAYLRRAPLEASPRLALLAGYVDLDHADLATENENPSEALAAIDRACALGDHWAFLKKRGEVLRDRGDREGSLRDLDRALALRPGNVEALAARAFTQLERKQTEAAAQDLLAALRVNPVHHAVLHLVRPMVTTLVADGWQLHKGGKRVEALRLFDLAAELAPLDREVLGRRTYVLTDGAPGVEALRAAVAASPDALIATQQLDYALAKQQRFDEVISLWNGFLSRNPEVGRAYCERAGAFAHLGRRAESIRDLERACELGITEGCARTSR